MKGKRKKTTTIVIDIPVYTDLKELKIIPEESFNSVIKRLLNGEINLKGQTKITKWDDSGTGGKSAEKS
jgi:predicted CopG family antitoxin